MSKCKRCADHLKADCKELKAQLEESSDTIRYVTGQRDEAWSRQDAAVAERDALKAEIGAAIAQKFADGLFQFVEVEGMVKQNEDGRVYQVAAEDVRVVEESSVPWEELFGYMPEITDGLPVADYLEGIRGEE